MANAKQVSVLYSRPHHGHKSLINPPYQIASPEVNYCPILTGQMTKSI